LEATSCSSSQVGAASLLVELACSGFIPTTFRSVGVDWLEMLRGLFWAPGYGFPRSFQTNSGVVSSDISQQPLSTTFVIRHFLIIVDDAILCDLRRASLNAPWINRNRNGQHSAQNSQQRSAWFIKLNYDILWLKIEIAQQLLVKTFHVEYAIYVCIERLLA
jgi:hypothetical protein